MAYLSRLFSAVLLAFAFVSAPLHAANLIRDADIEHALALLARPLITAAGLSPNRVQIMVLNDPKMNAFVIDNNHVFLNSGLILRMGSAAELQSVIAHELAHVSGGHIARRMGNLRTMRGTAGLGFLLALASVAAGAPEAASGIAIGVHGSAVGNFLSHTRAEESSADHAAIRYLARAQVDPRAMRQVLEVFRGQEALSSTRQDAYVRSHPLTADRLRALEAAVSGVEAFPPNQTNDYWFRRAQAKLGAFLTSPSATLRKFPKNDTSDIAELARAVAHHRKPDPAQALRHIDRAIGQRPDDGFLYDLKAQILLESRNFDAAVAAYRTADRLEPNHPQILAGMGRAMLATKRDGAQALKTLQAAYARDPTDPRMLRDLAVAYARSGENGMASLATAERYAMLGRAGDAELHAKRAADMLPNGSTAWRRARDVIQAAKLAQSERKGG